MGRKLFDVTNGWEGRHPLDVPVFVVTHEPPTDWNPAEPDPPFTFVTEGVEAAIEQATAVAGEKSVAVNGGTMARQALEAGLIDEIWIDLVPLLLGGGTPMFDRLKTAPVVLEGPVSIVEGQAVTHLRYLVKRLQSDRAEQRERLRVGRAGRGGVDDQPQVAAADGQLVAVERDPPDLGVLERLAVGEVARPTGRCSQSASKRGLMRRSSAISSCSGSSSG